MKAECAFDSVSFEVISLRIQTNFATSLLPVATMSNGERIFNQQVKADNVGHKNWTFHTLLQDKNCNTTDLNVSYDFFTTFVHQNAITRHSCLC